jgi:hypothetical protein
MEFIAIAKGRSRYRLFIRDIKKVYKLVKKKSYSVPVFKEKKTSISPTDGDIEDNAEINQ